MPTFDVFMTDNHANYVQSPLVVHTTATTDSGGAFSVDMTDLGLTHIYNVHATTLDTASGITNTTVTSVTSFSTSTVTGNVYQFTETLGVLNLSAVGASRTVYVTVFADNN